MRTEERTETTTSESAKGALKRRGILAAAGAVVAGIIAKQASEPAAAVGEVFSIPGDYTGNQIGTVWKITNTGSGDAIEGIGVAQGLGGFASGTGGIGVFGNTPSATGQGVYGRNSGTGGTATYGESQSGSSGKGVYGKSTVNGYGVYGQATTTNGYGVHGTVTNGDASSRGVSASAGLGTGVYATSSGGNGVYGFAGAAGTTAIVAGVFGDSSTTYGVIGRTTAAGYSGLTAITGTSGVAALAATSTNANAYAAYFTGTTVVQGNFAVVSGAKSAAVKDASGQHRLVYCVESPEAWFEDFGEGALVNGKAAVKLDPVFAQIVHADDYFVFPVSHDAANKGLAVTARTATGFTVQEQHGGASNGAFAYRVVAKRKDIKGERLAKFDLPKINHPDPDKLTAPAPDKANPPGKA